MSMSVVANYQYWLSHWTWYKLQVKLGCLQVAEAEKEGAVQQAPAQGWQREVALLEPQLQHTQAQLESLHKQVPIRVLLHAGVSPACTAANIAQADAM